MTVAVEPRPQGQTWKLRNWRLWPLCVHEREQSHCSTGTDVCQNLIEKVQGLVVLDRVGAEVGEFELTGLTGSNSHC